MDTDSVPILSQYGKPDSLLYQAAPILEHNLKPKSLLYQAAPILGHSREPGSLYMPGCANIGTQSGTRILVYARLRQYWDTVGNQEPCLYQAAPILGHSWYPINQANPNAPAPTQYWSNVGTDWQCYLGREMCCQIFVESSYTLRTK